MNAQMINATNYELAIRQRDDALAEVERLKAQQAPIQSAELTEMRKLAEAATPGPWVQSNKRIPYVKAIGPDSYLLHTMPIGDAAADFHPDTRARWISDAAFIAAANPAFVLRLLAALAAVPAQQQASTVIAEGDYSDADRTALAFMGIGTTAAPAHALTDAECHEILMAMKEHIQKWTDAQDLDDCDEENFPAFSGECIRFITANLARKG